MKHKQSIVSATDLRGMYLSRAKLKAVSRTSALLAGFAMVALVELDFTKTTSNATPINQGLLVTFAVCTTLLVSVHLLALMMSTCIEPHMDAMSNLQSQSAFMESPHITLKWYIELAWFFSTVLGLLLFLVEICVIFWLKFDFNPVSAYVATALLIPVFIIFILFAITFYRKLSAKKVEDMDSKIRDLEASLMQIDSHLQFVPGRTYTELETNDDSTSSVLGKIVINREGHAANAQQL